MKEIRTGGRKEFIYSVIWAVLLLFVGKIIIQILPTYKMAGGIATVFMFGILGFFVMTRYAAIFTYTLKGHILRINRKIGKRNKEIELKMSEIKSVSNKKPASMPRHRDVYIMCSSVFSKKKRYYIEYKKNNTSYVLVFEPSVEMVEKLNTLKSA